jgi:hypothetical protein
VKTVLAAFIASLGFAFAQPALADTVFVGGNPGFEVKSVTVDGTRQTVVQMTGYFHQMDLPPHSVQPIGLEEFFFVLKARDPWFADRCEKWITTVHDDEGAWTDRDPTYPYFEIDIAANARPLTINGLRVYREKDVLCWEAMDFGPPLY